MVGNYRDTGKHRCRPAGRVGCGIYLRKLSVPKAITIMQAGWNVNSQIPPVEHDLRLEHGSFLRDQRGNLRPIGGVKRATRGVCGSASVIGGRVPHNTGDIGVQRIHCSCCPDSTCVPVWVATKYGFCQCPPLHKSVVARPVKSVCEPDWRPREGRNWGIDVPWVALDCLNIDVVQDSGPSVVVSVVEDACGYPVNRLSRQSCCLLGRLYRPQ